MKQVVALVVAVALVAGALVIRSRLDDDGTTSSGEAAVVLCTPELAAVCEAVADDTGVEVRIEDYWSTVEGLAGDDQPTDVDAWVAPAPMVAMAVDERARQGQAPVLGEPSAPLARSPLVTVMWSDRQAALAEHCGGAVTWTCIGDEADQPWSELGGQGAWGDLKPGHDDPATSAEGLLVASQAAADRLGRPDFASNDFVEPGFRAWYEQLERTADRLEPPSGTALARMLSFGQAAFDVVGTTEAAAGPAVARSRDSQRLTVSYPSPAMTVDVVVVPVAGSDGGAAAEAAFTSDDAAAAFAAAGWRVDGQPPADGVPTDPPLPDDAGTPAGGVLQALRSLTQEVR